MIHVQRFKTWGAHYLWCYSPLTHRCHSIFNKLLRQQWPQWSVVYLVITQWRNCKVPSCAIIHSHSNTSRAKFVVFKCGFCINIVEAVHRARIDVFVYICKCGNMCVLLSPYFLWNKYAQHIYCLYLGKIDGIAGEQNIYHFCLWLIVVLRMAALQREGGGGGGEMRDKGGGGKQKTAVENDKRGIEKTFHAQYSDTFK